MVFELPKLSYKFDELEPYIDAKTMEIHYGKHHATYVQKLNLALEKFPNLMIKNIRELLIEIDEIPSEIRTVIMNNGGGHANHSLFWEILIGEKQECSGKILREIEKNFVSFDEFKKKFSETALNRFGSGWAWLVLSGEKLEIISTPNQDSPFMDGKIPILGLDVWEHAYYLKYQNRRAEYVGAFWNIINWKKVEENYLKEI